MNKIFLILTPLLILFASCGQDYSQEQKDEKVTSKFPKEQQRIIDKKDQANANYLNAPNEMQKNEIQNGFDKWLSSYLKDTLKGKIVDFYVTLDQLKNGKLSDFYYLFVDFKTEDKLHLYVEEDVKSEDILKKTSLYKIVKNARENQKVYLTAKFVKLKDYDVQDREYSSINYPRIYISVDTIK